MTLRIILVLLFFSSPLFAAEKTIFTYTVTKVYDGDTFLATDGNIKFKVRIAAMDAPEHDQSFGKMATYRLKELILNQGVTIAPITGGLDRYGRVLGLVLRGDQDLALTLIAEGLATYYRPTCQEYPAEKTKYNYEPGEYIHAEQVARGEKKNIWSEQKFILPCQFRKRTGEK